MNNKGLSLKEITIVIFIAGLGALLLLNMINADTINAMDRKRKKAQVISIDKKGNELWRVYDKQTSRFIYYMPKGSTSWDVNSGKVSKPMGVN